MGVPVWLWILLAVFAVVWFLRRSAAAYRDAVRGEFLDRLKAAVPEVEIVSQSIDAVELRGADGNVGTFRPFRLYREMTAVDLRDEEAKNEVYDKFVQVVGESLRGLEVDPQRDLARLRPRIVTTDFLTQLTQAAEGRKVPSRKIGVAGLCVVLVLDSENSVAYLQEELLENLGVDLDEAYRVALDNLREGFPHETVREPIDQGTVGIVHIGDSHDAARLLLIPEHLVSGQKLVALIPDRDLLVLAPVPIREDWKKLRKLARKTADEPLFPHPLLVDREGFQVVEAE